MSVLPVWCESSQQSIKTTTDNFLPAGSETDLNPSVMDT